MADILISFDGETRFMNDFLSDLFEAQSFGEGTTKRTVVERRETQISETGLIKIIEERIEVVCRERCLHCFALSPKQKPICDPDRLLAASSARDNPIYCALLRGR
jgi:hypothetical protein